jgi:hypothetical protein
VHALRSKAVTEVDIDCLLHIFFHLVINAESLSLKYWSSQFCHFGVLTFQLCYFNLELLASKSNRKRFLSYGNLGIFNVP